MVVLIVHILDTLADEPKRDTPIPADADGPGSLSGSPESMQLQARQVHVDRTDRDVKTTQDEPKPLGVPGLDSGFRACCKETLQAFVSKSLDGHNPIVTYHVTRYNPPRGGKNCPGTELVCGAQTEGAGEIGEDLSKTFLLKD